jgi:branched-chain amino acid transport system ATP-binding protein
MTVEENLELGGWTFRRDKKQVRDKIEANYERFPVLKEKRRQITGELSGGQQRMVEIGRTLMADPKMLLVDEPTAGLSKMLSQEVYEMLTALTSLDDITILLVDQEIRQALKIADYVYVLELGRNKYEGQASDFEDLEKAFWVA